jgi:hypothetical protein
MRRRHRYRSISDHGYSIAEASRLGAGIRVVADTAVP